MTHTNQLIAHQLSCQRQGVWLFENISFELNPGNALLIEGPNGSGKSSLLKIIASLATPSCGNVLWNNQSILSARNQYNEQLHYLGHTNGIKLELTVLENLQLACLLNSLMIPTNIDSILSLLNLQQYKNTFINKLSAGQQRRVALAKLFLIKKQLWLLDEPYTALDTATQEIFLAQLKEHLQNEGMAIISSHHPIALKDHPMQMLRLNPC